MKKIGVKDDRLSISYDPETKSIWEQYNAEPIGKAETIVEAVRWCKTHLAIFRQI